MKKWLFNDLLKKSEIFSKTLWSWSRFIILDAINNDFVIEFYIENSFKVRGEVGSPLKCFDSITCHSL